MNMAKSNNKNKISDWFVIQKIRLTNFIKEHKYISSFIGIFLVSSLIALVVFAAEDSTGPATISGVAVKKMDSSEPLNADAEVNSFSTIVYEVKYTTDYNTTTIKATIPENIDAVWDTSDPSSTYEASEDGKTIDVKIYDNDATTGEKTKQLYLNVKNIKNGTQIQPTFSSSNDLKPNTVIIKSEKVELTPKIVSGMAYKTSDYTNGRLAPFGILVGFDKSKLKGDHISFEGLYFDSNLSLILEATQTSNNVSSQIELKNDNNKYFGLYDKSSNLLPSMPHYINDYQRYSVYNSGKVTNLVKSNSGSSGAVTERKNPDLYLIGNQTINLEVGEKYEEYGISTTDGGSAICKTSSASCTRVIKDQSGNEVTEANITNSVGDYIVSYEYTTEEGITKVNRNIKVVEKTTVTLNDDVYALKGNKNVTLLRGTAYSESGRGITKNGVNYYGYESVITRNSETGDETLDRIDGSTPGTYTITYTISDTTSPVPDDGGTTGETTGETAGETGGEAPIEEESAEKVTLTRTVKVIESLSYLKAQTLVASTIYAPSDGSFANPYINLDGKDIECNSESGCVVNYYDPITNNETTIDKQKAGTYNAIYKITDKNGFELQAGNTVNIQTKYDFNIEGIKSDGTINLYDNDFVVLGSYFVNAVSPRTEGVTEDIAVKLKIGDVVSENVINKVYSAGTKTNNLTFNTASNDILTPLSADETLSYGEEVILKSVFNYSSDGDENIDKLTTTIPVGNAVSSASNPTAPFTMTEYSKNIESPTPYYMTVNGNNMNCTSENGCSIKYYACEMEEAGTSCISGTGITYETFETLNDALSKNEKLRLANLTYTLNDVVPGSEVDFRVRLVTNVGNHAGTLTMTSTASFDEKQESGINQNKKVSASSSIKVTAFKARTKVFVDNSEQDIIINGADVNSSTWTIYPTVTLPAEQENTNAAAINELNEIKIEVNLPNGINYLHNENYDIPVISNNGKTLTYVLKGKHVNEWIDPIMFDASYDINIPSGTLLPVNVIIQATSGTKGNEIIDASSEKSRTTTRVVKYQNNEIIAYSQYTPYTAISKEQSFKVSTRLYNNDSNNLTHSNLDIVTILPYNDVSNEKNSYTGTYTISNLPSGAMCTTNIPTLIGDHKKLLSDEEIVWEECSKYKEEEYVGVTAVRVNGISLTANKTYEQSIDINPSGNNTDDLYQINSYLIMDDSDGQRVVKNIKALNVTVISKKITGTVWEDFDANGLMDFEEKKVSGVTLKLYNAENDEVVKTTTSDEKGKYSLSDLSPGTYYVVAEYNTAKYGLSPYQVSLDKSVVSSFYSLQSQEPFDEETEEINPDESIDEEETEEMIPGESIDEEETEEMIPDESTGEEETCEGEECESDEAPEDTQQVLTVIRTENIEITDNTKVVSNINLGLALKKEYSVKLTKYVTKAITTNNLGVSTIKDYGNATLAKLDVKDISNLNIKVIYTIELENTGYYPGYIYAVKDYVPDGMKFNETYEENKGWVMTDQGYLENNTLFDQLVNSGEKKYLTIAFDISRKEAGSFVNYAAVDDEDLQILVVAERENEEGDSNE